MAVKKVTTRRMKDRYKDFLKYCVAHIPAWPAGFTAAVSFQKTPFKRMFFVERHGSLSRNIWSVVTKAEWKEASEKTIVVPKTIQHEEQFLDWIAKDSE